MNKIDWSVCRQRGCEYYSPGFAGTECLLGLDYDRIIICQQGGSWKW